MVRVKAPKHEIMHRVRVTAAPPVSESDGRCTYSRRYEVLLTHSHLDVLQKVSSGTLILLKITWE